MTGALVAVQKLNEADISTLDGLAAGGKQKRYAFSPMAYEVIRPSNALHRFITPPWRAYIIHPFNFEQFILIFPLAALDLGFENWP
jgi:hypothetical protein